MFKKEFIYDFIEEGYKGQPEFKLAINKLINRMDISGYHDVANEIKNIKKRNSRAKSKAKKAKDSDRFKYYHDNIKNKADLLFKGYKHDIINSAILYGKPGTGKTHFVEQFSKHNKIEVISMNLSSILDFRYGESIKRLEAFINTNKDKQHIIFLDEADSIFSKRGNSQDVFETSRIITTMLQLLDQKRKALIIFSTNLIDDIDKAIIRRFDIKISFDYEIIQRINMLKDFLLQHNIELSDDESKLIGDKINGIEKFTISDVKILSKRIAIIKLQDGDTEEMSSIVDGFLEEFKEI